MKFKFKGNEYTYDELRDAKVNLIIDICKSLNMDYKYYAPFLYKNRNVIITEFFNRQRVNDCEKNEKKAFVDNKNQSANKQNEKFKYSYEDLLAKDFTDLVDICLSNTVINDNEVYDFSKSELISKLHENFIKPVEEMIIKEKAQQEEIERLEKEESQRRENEKIQQKEREKEELRQQEKRQKEELRQQEERAKEELRQQEERKKIEQEARENEKYNKDNIENEINKFFTDIAKLDIGSILENVNDAIININEDEIISKGSKFAQDAVLEFDEFLEEAIKNVQEQKENQKSEEDIYIPILTLDKNKYDYDLKDKFANAFKRFRTLGKSRCKMLVLSEAGNKVELEKITFNFEFVDDILHAKCDVENDIETINTNKFDLIFLDENINSILIKNVINTVSDLKVEMLDNHEIQAEVGLINNYIDNGEINILLSYKKLKKAVEKVMENKTVFYKNIQGDRQVIIDENKNECDVRRIKTAKALKLFIKSDLSAEEIELAKIDFTSLEISSVLGDKYDKYKNIGEFDLIISFKKTDDGKLSYRIFVKQDGQLMYSDKCIIEY